MDKNVLLYVKSRFIKNILLKSVVKAQIGVIDIIDPDDMTIKLDAYGDSIVLAVIEITDDNKASVYEVVNRIKDVYPSVPVVAIVYKDTYEIVNFAIRLGVKDILFLTKNVETYVEAIQNKMANYYDIIKKQEKDTFLSEMINEDINIRESLNLELKRAIRGNYSISFILAYLSGHEPEVVQSIINTSKRFIRDTDKLLLMDEDTLLQSSLLWKKQMFRCWKKNSGKLLRKNQREWEFIRNFVFTEPLSRMTGILLNNCWTA